MRVRLRAVAALAITTLALLPRAALGGEPTFTETMANLKQLAAPVERIVVRFDLGLAAALASSRAGRTALGIEIAPRPDYWYGFAVAALSDPKIEIAIDPTTGAPARRAISSNESIALSARFFKQIGPLVLSAGMVDNRAGAGAELRVFGDRLRVETVIHRNPWQTSGPPRLRVGASVQWRSLYLQAGAQDVLDPTRAAYVGVGLRWSDEDIKYALPWLSRL
jgi:hypothetical protein